MAIGTQDSDHKPDVKDDKSEALLEDRSDTVVTVKNLPVKEFAKVIKKEKFVTSLKDSFTGKN